MALLTAHLNHIERGDLAHAVLLWKWNSANKANEEWKLNKPFK